MKLRRRRILLLVLFLLALGGEALHTLHAHHDGSHCSVCSLQSHNVGTDTHADTVVTALYVSHETPATHTGLPYRFTILQTFYGRAPPLSISQA